jgi:hypothetical protein
MAQDAAHGEVVLFGGTANSGTRFGDTWVFPGRVIAEQTDSSATSGASLFQRWQYLDTNLSGTLGDLRLKMVPTHQPSGSCHLNLAVLSYPEGSLWNVPFHGSNFHLGDLEAVANGINCQDTEALLIPSSSWSKWDGTSFTAHTFEFNPSRFYSFRFGSDNATVNLSFKGSSSRASFPQGWACTGAAGWDCGEEDVNVKNYYFELSGVRVID